MLYLVIAILVIALVAAGFRIVSLQKKVREVQKGDHIKRAFLRNIGHEVRTPLKAVQALASTVGKDDLYLSKNEKRDIADQLEYNTNLIGTLLDEVLLFTDSESEGHQLHDDSFSPNALCRRCLEANMFSLYHRQAVKLNFKREMNDEFFCKSDRHVVELILNKLILNACRFTEEGEITVGCNTSEHVGRLTIFVMDTGMGIPENRLGNLFTWFDEPDNMKDEAELDLSICKRLAEKLGGTISHDTTYEQGTRLLLILPLK